MNKPIGCTKCGGNDHNTDECRRFALVPVEPTPVMLDVAVSHALMVSLSGDYNWSAYMRDVWLRMVAAAAPAQGQQVECQECERLRAEVTRLHALVSNYRTAESLLCAELAALKAQQVEQKPVEAVHLGWDYLDDRTKVATYFVPCPGDTPPKLYTEPKPAPAQDVAIPERKETGEWESARIADFNSGWNACLDEVVALLGKAAWMELDTTNRSISIQDEIRSALAAHDKQSGGEA